MSAELILAEIAKRRQKLRDRLVTTVHFTDGSVTSSRGVVIVEDDAAELDAAAG